MILSYQYEEAERLDKFLASRFSNYSRSYFQRLIESGHVLVNKNQQKSRYFLRKNDSIEINFVKFKNEFSLNPSNIELDVIYENDDIIAINKQAGLVVHPAIGNIDGTLVNALLKKYPRLIDVVLDKNSEISRSRPGIVHRLDKDTSGIILVAKNKKALVSLFKQIKNRVVRKIYWALCYGWPKEKQGRIISYLGRNPKNRKMVTNLGQETGKEAISVYRVIKYLVDNKNDRYSIVEFNIQTGRTHQIRYQAASIQLPIMGDRVYGSKNSINASNLHNVGRQMLHAKHIEFYSPGDTNLTVLEAPLPKDMKSIIDNFDIASR
jgi:23S rRNA pseudouridine1911/1915/1917 synthase